MSEFIRKICFPFKAVYRGFKNIVIWFPVIWNDRNWDQFYIYKIIKYKLIQMEKYHRNYGISINSNQIAKEIKLCINLLNRIIDDGYLDNVIDPHNKKWGEMRMIFEDHPTDNSLCELKEFQVENAITEKEKIQEEKERSRLYKHSDNLKKQDLDMLFIKLRKHIECWWD